IMFSYDTMHVDIPSYNKDIVVDKLTLFWSHREDDVLVYTPIYLSSLALAYRHPISICVVYYITFLFKKTSSYL
ncbi:MAG: hypothetical protein ACVCEJ_10010, partial [Candidatus Izemoplasmataceae bacterium]